MESRNKVLLKLFLSTLYLSAFTFGGICHCFPDEEKVR